MWSTSDPVSRVGLFIAIILIAAQVGGDLASRLRQPSVLGELVIGLVLGSLPLRVFRELQADPGVDLLARLGVLVLLFEVGLESTVREVTQVGVASARVAVLGSIATLFCGWLAARLAIPGAGTFKHMFVGAALAATSIAISARVRKDAGASRTTEARVILGASVLDDVLGLVFLALAGGAAFEVRDRAVSFAAVAWLVIKTLLFLVGALAIGQKFSVRLFRFTARLRTSGALLAVGLSFCFALAWASDRVGLAPFVGAFAAGLILEDAHSARFVERGEPSLGEQMELVSSWMVPIFFVVMGMRTDLPALCNPASVFLVAALLVAAVVGKLACAGGAPRGTDRLAVAMGMMPRGEVTLVFASLGVSRGAVGRPLLDSSEYSALVAVVVLTTLATPPTLRWRLRARGLYVPPVRMARE